MHPRINTYDVLVRKKEDRERWLSNDLKFDDAFAKEEKKQNMDMISFTLRTCPRGIPGQINGE